MCREAIMRSEEWAELMGAEKSSGGDRADGDLERINSLNAVIITTFRDGLPVIAPTP